jgi:hypothetical protein
MTDVICKCGHSANEHDDGTSSIYGCSHAEGAGEDAFCGCMESREELYLSTIAALTADRDRLARELAEAQDTISNLTPVTLRYQEVIQYTLAQMEYLQHLWGKEGVSDNVVDRLREAIHPEPK